MSDAMDIRDFVERLERYGAELDRWPPSDAAAARALLDRSAAARSELAMSRQIEQVLANEPSTPSAALRERVLGRAPGGRERATTASPTALGGVATTASRVATLASRRRHSSMHELWTALGGVRIAGPALAAALVLGLALGITAPADVDDGYTDEDEELVDFAQLTSDYPDY